MTSYRVVAFSGFQGEQEPRYLVTGRERVEIEIRRQWLEPDARCFRARGAGREYLLRYSLTGLDWSVEETT